jgi:hypothetical protein
VTKVNNRLMNPKRPIWSPCLRTRIRTNANQIFVRFLQFEKMRIRFLSDFLQFEQMRIRFLFDFIQFEQMRIRFLSDFLQHEIASSSDDANTSANKGVPTYTTWKSVAIGMADPRSSQKVHLQLSIIARHS